MIAPVIALLIELSPGKIIELHKCFWHQAPAGLADAALGDPAGAELLVVRLPEEAISLPL